MDEFKQFEKIMKHANDFRHVERGILLSDGNENDEEHTFGIIFLITLLRPWLEREYFVDWSKVYALATIHDFPEVLTGDVVWGMPTEGKAERESMASRELFDKFPHMENLWYEYETRKSTESILVKKLDVLQCVWRIFHENGITWQNHGDDKEKARLFARGFDKGSDLIGRLLNALYCEAEARGMYYIKEMDTAPGHRDHTGRLFKNFREMALAWGVPYEEFLSRRKGGYSLEHILTKKRTRSKELKVSDHLGNMFMNETAMAIYYYIRPAVFKARKVAMSLEQALTMPDKGWDVDWYHKRESIYRHRYEFDKIVKGE
jgi:putative hydrolase of HD superfamily